MNKTRFLMGLISALALQIYAQGTVSWFPNPADFTIQTNSTQYSPLIGGGSTGGGAVGYAQGSISQGAGYYAALLYQPFTGTQAPVPTTIAGLLGWSDSGLLSTNGISSLNPGSLVAVNGSTAATVPWAAGTTDSIMMVAWSQNLGSTFAGALSAIENETYFGESFFGESATGYISPNSANPGAVLFDGGQPSISGQPIYSPNTQLYILPVPEPTTFALAGLGVLALLKRR